MMSTGALRTSLALVLVAALSQLAAGHEEHMELANKQVTLRDICANRQVPIISVDEARRLINELKADPSACPQSYVQSFFELEPILVLERSEQACNGSPCSQRKERLCGERKFDQIKEYHFRYINPLVETYKLGDDLNTLGKKIVRRPLNVAKVDYTVQLDEYKQEILIPISLQQFFKAWALQVSGTCKRTLVDNLDKAMQLFTDADFALMDELATPGQAARDPLTGKPIESHKLSFGELAYMPRLEGELEPGDAELRDRTTILDLRSQPQLDRLMQACQRRFKPVYSKLVLPIVRLTKLGYDYVGPQLDGVRQRLESDADLRRWMALTKICESPGNFELVESATDSDSQAAAPAAQSAAPLDYEPMYSYPIEGALWVRGAEALAKELNRASGYNSKGFRKFLFKSGVAGRRLVAAIDPHQFAWYRRNQNTLSSTLNTASILSNTVSMIWG